MTQLLITFIVKEWQDGNAAGDVESEAQRRVIDEDHVLKVPVRNDAQVLDEAERCLNAVLTIQSRAEYFAVLFDIVQNSVCVNLITRRERHELVRLAELVQMLQ